jgi:eukaryotic-like serine/threonine-protein kinase
MEKSEVSDSALSVAAAGATVALVGEHSDGTDDEPEILLDLLMAWEQQYRQGLDPTPECVALGHPELVGRLRDKIAKHKALLALMQMGDQTVSAHREAETLSRTPPGYESLGEIGRGGMGVVFKARDVSLGRTVAIKTIAEGQFATQDQRDRFRAEALAVARLRHPNIISIYAIGEHEKHPYLSLEFAEGGSLAERLAEKPMSPREAAILVETLARAVESAHCAGVVHRDLKPSNVLLTADGVLKISDFGLAKLLDFDSVRTVSGQIIGSPSYMAPEQAEGRVKQVGPSADIYALGAILYQMLTGRPPFLGETQLETLALVKSAEPVAPRQLRLEIPRDLETICLKCLEKVPARRYASAGALSADLARYLEGRPVEARRASAPERCARWCKRNPWIATSAAVLMLGTVISISQAARATLAERAALRAKASAIADQKRAENEAANARAVRDFLNIDVLAQASAENQHLPDGKPNPNLTVRGALDQAAATIGERFKGQPLVEASIRLTIGETYEQLGLLKEAGPQLRSAYELRRRELGDEAPETLTALCSVGRLLLADDKIGEAEAPLRQAARGLERIQGLDHFDTLCANIALAQVLHGQEKYVEAEQLLADVLDRFRRSGNDTLPEAIGALNDLAVTYLDQKKFNEAEKMLNGVVETLKRKRGAEHPHTLRALSNLTGLYFSQGQHNVAIARLNDVVALQRSVLGKLHPDTLGSMIKLGQFYLFTDRLAEAERILEDAKVGCRSVLDSNHTLMDAVLVFLSVIYSRTNKYEELGPVLTEARDITRARWGPNNELTADANQSLGFYHLYYSHDFAKAEACFRERLSFFANEKPTDWRRYHCASLLGQALLDEKKYTEALQSLVAAYNDMDAAPKPLEAEKNGQMRQTIDLLSRAYADAGDAAEALRWRSRYQDFGFPEDPFAEKQCRK